MIGDGLSHVAFGAVALGLFTGIYPLFVALPVVALGSYFILKLTERAKVYGDAAIGIVSAVGIAGGVILATMAHGFNVDLLGYLFGNILAISGPETIAAITLSIIVIIVVIMFYHDLFSATFDEEQAKVSGIATGRLNTMLVLLTAVTVVLAVRVVGIMLVSALLILPAVTSLQLAKSLKFALLMAAGGAVFSVILGITISYYLDLPAGAAIVILNFILFLIALAVNRTGR